MSARARLELFAVALLVACKDASPPKHNLEERWAAEERAASLRAAMFHAMGTSAGPDRSLQEWLERPETCSVSNTVTRLEMAAGTFVWPDVFQFRGDEIPAFSHLRERWRDFVRITLDLCDAARFGPALRHYKKRLESEVASPRARRAIERLFDGNEDEQALALRIIALAPNRVYYDRVASLAREGGHRVGTIGARGAMISIESLFVIDDLPEAWRSWIQQQLDDEQVRGLRQLLSIATGNRAPGAPEEEISLEVRRAAARTARLWRDTTRDGRLVVDDRIITLAKDPDDAIRREGVLMIEPTVTPFNVDLLETIATTDENPRIRLIAFVSLPKQRAERIPIEQQP